MRKAVLRVCVTAVLLSAGFGFMRAAAETATAQSAMAATGAPLVREAAIVCGGTGCNPVQTKAQKRRKFQPLGYTKPVKQSAISSRSAIG